jgi:hypothetical protein
MFIKYLNTLLFVVLAIAAIVVTIILTGCTFHTPKYTAGTYVQIKNGFFKGCIGIVTDFSTGTCAGRNGQYTLFELHCSEITKRVELICADEVE